MTSVSTYLDNVKYWRVNLVDKTSFLTLLKRILDQPNPYKTKLIITNYLIQLILIPFIFVTSKMRSIIFNYAAVNILYNFVAQNIN